MSVDIGPLREASAFLANLLRELEGLRREVGEHSLANSRLRSEVEERAAAHEALRAQFLELADAILPSSTSTAQLIGRVRQLRAAEDRAREDATMRRVIVESPYAGDVERNLRYLRAAMRDCLLRGETPFASHALYTQPGVLNDDAPLERARGIEAGLAWGAVADATVVYMDLGESRGMQQGIADASKAGRSIEYRSLPEWKNLSFALELAEGSHMAAATPEPPPVPTSGPALWDLVIADATRLKGHGDATLVIADMRARDGFGRAKYGTPLQAGNGRDALHDAYQEALDLAVYLRQELEESYDGLVASYYTETLGMVFGLRAILDERAKKGGRGR